MQACAGILDAAAGICGQVIFVLQWEVCKTTSLWMKTEVTNVIMIFLASENWTQIYMAKAEISTFAL